VLFACGILFVFVKYTIPMVKLGALPLDLGFVATQGMDNVVVTRPGSTPSSLENVQLCF
jgi:hypothetical protein